MLIRCLYLPEAVEMQARGAFSELAWPRILGAPVSLAGSLLLVLMAPPEWTIVAICLGEGLSALALLRAHARLTGRQGGETERQGAPA
jgi:O-antigen/teichoic acid export membrane protein